MSIEQRLFWIRRAWSMALLSGYRTRLGGWQSVEWKDGVTVADRIRLAVKVTANICMDRSS